jgi:hypothetical protein
MHNTLTISTYSGFINLYMYIHKYIYIPDGVSSKIMNRIIYTYIYILIYVCVCVYVYIYIPGGNNELNYIHIFIYLVEYHLK